MSGSSQRSLSPTAQCRVAVSGHSVRLPSVGWHYTGRTISWDLDARAGTVRLISRLGADLKAPPFVPGGIRNVHTTRQHNIMCTVTFSDRERGGGGGGVCVVPNKVVGGSFVNLGR